MTCSSAESTTNDKTTIIEKCLQNAGEILIVELMNLTYLFSQENIFDHRLLCLKEYDVCITTGDTDDAETKENAWIVLEGKKGQSKEFVMENSSKKKRFLR